MTIITEKMVAGGSCIARIDGKAVFVPLSLPGETLDIEITEDRKDYSFARIVSVLEPSPSRVTPPCPLFGRCGGCTLQMADSAAQGELRLSILRDVLSRAGLRPETPLRAETGEPFGYRSRFQFHRTPGGGIGLKAASSDEIIPLADCPVAVAEIRDALADGSLARSARHRNTGDRFHVFAHGGELWHEDGNTDCQVRLAGRDIRFDVRGFFQSNLPLLERLIGAACGGPGSIHADPRSPDSSDTAPAGNARLLDFYAGVGTFSAFAGERYAESVLVEHNREALEFARTNAASGKKPPVLCAVSDERWPSRSEARLRYDTAIVDPPRQGISKKALEWFMSSGIPEIRYVSCDPVTFARDAARLVASGYTLTDAVMYDFYPQTHHLETFGTFRR